MEIVVVSDSHGRIEVLSQIRERHPYADAYLHCGDSETDEDHLDSFASVQGNNDMYYNYPESRVIDLGACKILVIHGHQHYYGTRVRDIAARAKKIGCTMAFFGHTHTFFTSIEDGVLMVNPGSVHHNRDGSQPCYALVHNRDGGWKVERMAIPEPVKTTKKRTI
jgi:putative phosphoesterase